MCMLICKFITHAFDYPQVPNWILWKWLEQLHPEGILRAGKAMCPNPQNAFSRHWKQEQCRTGKKACHTSHKRGGRGGLQMAIPYRGTLPLLSRQVEVIWSHGSHVALGVFIANLHVLSWKVILSLIVFCEFVWGRGVSRVGRGMHEPWAPESGEVLQHRETCMFFGPPTLPCVPIGC